MLSRVASHLYWLSRHLERAENMARILDVGQSLVLLSGRADDESIAAEPLVITETRSAFTEAGHPVSAARVARFLAWDDSLPSSIYNCLQASRENARAVRGSITSEMWENINDTWLQLVNRKRTRGEVCDAEFFDWVKERSHMFRGISFATSRRDQAYHFIRLGTFIERADNTARILSVKHAVAPKNAVNPAPVATDDAGGTGVASNTSVGTALDEAGDYYRLSAMLRSVSSLEAYRDTYRDSIDSRRVAELLIFNPTIPRSLRFCFDEIERILLELPQQTGRTARRLAATIGARLRYGDVQEVYANGLYESLERFLRDNTRLGEAVNAAYLELI